MERWPISEVDKLIYSTLANDSTIKQKQGVDSTNKARVSGYRVVTDKDYFPFVYFYSITGPNKRVNGNTVVQFNPDYAIEVRTLGAPTDDSEAVVARVDELIGTMKKQLTSDSKWVVSAVARSPIMITEQGEIPEVYYTRRGSTYRLSVVRA